MTFLDDYFRHGLFERFCRDTRPDLKVEYRVPTYQTLGMKRIQFWVSDGKRDGVWNFDVDWHFARWVSEEYQDRVIRRLIDTLKTAFACFPTNGPGSIGKSLRYRNRTKRSWR